MRFDGGGLSHTRGVVSASHNPTIIKAVWLKAIPLLSLAKQHDLPGFSHSKVSIKSASM
jgi:hypothetical protein